MSGWALAFVIVGTACPVSIVALVWIFIHYATKDT